MSRPEGAMRLPIDSDLSEVTLEEAMDMLPIRSTYCLVISEADKGVAASLHNRRIHGEIDSSFRPDEWCLRAGDQSVWSPGP